MKKYSLITRDDWIALTDEELETRLTRLSGRSKVCIYAVLASLGIIIGAMFLPISDRVLLVAFLALVGSVLGILWTDQSMRILQPLKLRQDLTDRAVEALQNPSARAYRDHVVAHGRELVVGDLSFLEELSNRDQVDARAKILHG